MTPTLSTLAYESSNPGKWAWLPLGSRQSLSTLAAKLVRPVPTNIITIRYPKPMVERVQAIADINGVSFSDVVRLSVARQLPDFESGSMKIQGVEVAG